MELLQEQALDSLLVSLITCDHHDLILILISRWIPELSAEKSVRKSIWKWIWRKTLPQMWSFQTMCLWLIFGESCPEVFCVNKQ